MKTLPWANTSRITEPAYRLPSPHWRPVLACDAAIPTPVHRLFAAAQTSGVLGDGWQNVPDRKRDHAHERAKCPPTSVSHQSFYASVVNARRAVQQLQQAQPDRLHLNASYASMGISATPVAASICTSASSIHEAHALPMGVADADPMESGHARPANDTVHFRMLSMPSSRKLPCLQSCSNAVHAYLYILLHSLISWSCCFMQS